MCSSDLDTHAHFWDPLDTKYIDFSENFDVENKLLMPEEFLPELQCPSVMKLDKKSKIKLANESFRWQMSAILHGEQASLNELSVKAAQGDTQAASALKNFAAKAATAGRFIKTSLGPLAIAAEFALEGGIALNTTLSEGVPFKQAFADSYINKYVFGPKIQIDKEAEIAKEMAKGEEFAMAKRGERMRPFMAQSATADAQGDI